ncbi:MAG: HD domain-containing phosphohydrolase [Sideroxyarcus sp.]|nr:HD domain-containing phosphohydrolase [Sideroxyarcus sp.]
METTKVKAYMAQEQAQRSTLESLLNRLNDLNIIGASLSSERNIDKLLEGILGAAMKITNADAGTLYLVDAEKQVLTFEILHNLSLDIFMGGTSGNAIPFYPIQLYSDGQANHATVVSYAALSGETVNIPDAYIAEGFDFSGTRQFDAKTGYRSRSFLTVPMRNHEHEVIGVLQLINALDANSGVLQFSQDDQKLLESLASQAAIAISNRRLIQQLEELFESFIKLINTAIDDKSPYTGGHCARVPALTMMLAEAASRTETGPLKDFKLTDQDRYELKMAGLLHDCGKITTPVHVVDKATKLHTLFDRIRLIDTRFEVLKRDAEIEMLRGVISEESFMHRIAQADDDREFLRHCNIGSEKMSDADVERVQRIARYRWRNAAGVAEDFLSADELENLTIRAGTLTAAEREIINHHIVVTIKMLESLPWPTHLKRVPEYAGGHHERMDGKGYPKGLTREQMSVQARLMGIADIFEALTAKDRPYKEGKTLTESLTILGNFKQNGHIDPDLFDAFIRQKVYLEYARQFLAPEQIDEVDLSRIPGVNPESQAEK